jgi:hypothetical protein
LSGYVGESEPINYELEEPLPLSVIPGLSDALENVDPSMLAMLEMMGGMPDLDAIAITSVTFQVKSVIVKASFPDEEDTSKLQFNVVAETTFSFTTSDGMIENIMAGLALLTNGAFDFSKLTITTVIDSEKSIE